MFTLNPASAKSKWRISIKNACGKNQNTGSSMLTPFGETCLALRLQDLMLLLLILYRRREDIALHFYHVLELPGVAEMGERLASVGYA